MGETRLDWLKVQPSVGALSCDLQLTSMGRLHQFIRGTRSEFVFFCPPLLLHHHPS